MALTVGNLFKESVKYRMKLLAGHNGLHRPVQWVHIIETKEGAGFLHGNEVVITEGILGQEEAYLYDFVETIFARNASALIINTGMFIKMVPRQVVAFCEQHDFPLFVVPWDVPLVDLTREYCKRIIDNDVREDSIVTTLKNLLFHTGDKEALIHQMERYGYLSSSTMTFLCISIALENDTEEFVNESRNLKLLVEGMAKSIKDQCISFEYQQRRIMVLIDYTKEQLTLYLDHVFKKMSASKMLKTVNIGVSDTVKGLEHQDANFMRAYAACEIAIRKQERILHYTELGLYKLLIDIGNAEVLSDFYYSSLGKLTEYDEKNGTDYHHFMLTYMECNGHQGDVSQKLFIHRNTVNNYLKKVEEIMEIDLASWEGRAKLYTAYCIERLL